MRYLLNTILDRSEHKNGLKPSFLSAAFATRLVGRAYLSNVARCRLVLSAVDNQAGW